MIFPCSPFVELQRQERRTLALFLTFVSFRRLVAIMHIERSYQRGKFLKKMTVRESKKWSLVFTKLYTTLF